MCDFLHDHRNRLDCLTIKWTDMSIIAPDVTHMRNSISISPVFVNTRETMNFVEDKKKRVRFAQVSSSAQTFHPFKLNSNLVDNSQTMFQLYQWLLNVSLVRHYLTIEFASIDDTILSERECQSLHKEEKKERWWVKSTKSEHLNHVALPMLSNAPVCLTVCTTHSITSWVQLLRFS